MGIIATIISVLDNPKWAIRENKKVDINGYTIDPKNISKIGFFTRFNKRIKIGENLSYKEKKALINVMLNSKVKVTFTTDFELSVSTPDSKYSFDIEVNVYKKTNHEAVIYFFELMGLPNQDILLKYVNNFPLYQGQKGLKDNYGADMLIVNNRLEYINPIIAEIIIFNEQIRDGALAQFELEKMPGFGQLTSSDPKNNPNLNEPNKLPNAGTVQPTNTTDTGTIGITKTTNLWPWAIGILIFSKIKKQKQK